MNKRLATDKESGFTIIEVMVAIFILVLGVLGVAVLANAANVISVTTKARVGATNLAREMLEGARTFDYADLTGAVPSTGSPPNTALADDFTGIGLGDADVSASGWQIERAGTTYTVSVFTCVVDDSHDGVRAVAVPDVNPAGPYCAGSPAAGSGSTVDTNPDDGRKVEVSVAWGLNNVVSSCAGSNGTSTAAPLAGIGKACVTQAELIPNPAGGLGPAIVTLLLHTPGTVETGNSVAFDATTSTSADSVTWGADDSQGGVATGNGAGTAWTFSWPLTANTPDGSHLVTAQAFVLTAGGVPKQVTANLNRNIPAVPNISGGGVDTRIQGNNPPVTAQPAAALNWQQNSDNDIIGYTVYRATTAAPLPLADPPVCSTASVAATSCFDAPGPPPTDLSSKATVAACPVGFPLGHACINYYVIPFDQKWTTRSNLDATRTVLNGNCPGSPWTVAVVPTPPIANSFTTSTLSSTSQWANARAGCPSAFITIDYTAMSANPRPAAPQAATPPCTTDTGQAVINWSTPSPSTGIVSFRIYRDPPQNPPNYNDPAFTIDNPAATSFKDPNPTGGTDHHYFVTSVDGNFQESDPLPIDWTAAGCP